MGEGSGDLTVTGPGGRSGRWKLTWQYQDEWKQRFTTAKHAAHVAFGHRDTVTVLSIVLSRIYTLRNQLVHGGATWNSSVNRDQIRDCTNLMGKLVPLVIETMMDHPEALWGDVCYPVVD